jgi:hypothetical protein
MLSSGQGAAGSCSDPRGASALPASPAAGLLPIATAIQAVTGSRLDDVQVEGNRSITEDLSADDSEAHVPARAITRAYGWVGAKVGMRRTRPGRAGRDVAILI